MEILATLHPDNNPNDDLFPNVKKENIPSKAINLSKLSPEVQAKIPKVINTDTLLPATKLKYLEIDGVTYYIPQRVDVTSNIKITGNKSDIISSNHNLLCILSGTSSLAIRVVDKIEGGSEELSTLSEVLPQEVSKACLACYGDNIYIFGGYGNNGKLDTIYKYNCNTETISTLNVVLPKKLYSASCEIYNENIYIFGGYDNNSDRVNTIYKFDCNTETISTLSVVLPKAMSDVFSSIYNSYIYIFGYVGSEGVKAYKFDCMNETISTINVALSELAWGHTCSIYNDDIYIFGGGNSNGYLNTIYKFNCTNETFSTLSVVLPQALSSSCCSIYNSYIYIFGGTNGSAVNTIYKFNCITETIETLSEVFPQPISNSFCTIYNNNIYIFGGYSTSGYLNTIYNFSVSFELTSNNVLIYNANSKYSFDLIIDQVTIPINKVYIGDSNNTAQLANAYLYDETQTAWVNVNTGEVLTL